MNSLDTIDSLIYTMTLSAATDGDISDKEINTINFLFTTLPIFKNSNNDYLSKKMIECMELTKEEDNFENLIDLINNGLNSNKELKKTAYILALEVMMADLNIADESIRFLEILGLSLNLDNLEISSMKHTIRSKYAEDES
ncbi:tellurite resistance TerB family protein [Hyphomicrobiales bacterium]|nr:tellurite resistance TerB family protein [Hyphomicrobiales bacterium]